MFKPKNGYFSKIECPSLKQNIVCDVVNCIFKHPESKKRSLGQEEELQNATKRAKVENESSLLLPKSVAISKISRQSRTVAARKLAKFFKDVKHLANSNKVAIDAEYSICIESKSEEEYQDRLNKIINGLNAKNSDVKGDPRFILPRDIVNGNPAPIQERKKYIQSIVDVYREVTPGLKTPILQATEDEFKIASDSTKNTYAQTVKRFVYDLKRNPEKNKKSTQIDEKELLSRLRELIISKEKLARFGYIVDVPSFPTAISDLDDTRPCKRCGKEFKLADQLKPTRCLYHSGRNRKKDNFVRAWTCCGGIVGDCDECSVSEHHVYQWSTPEELHDAIPFTHTNDLPTNKRSFAALGLDCEMGYTTLGFELLRTTAVDFVTGEEVIDILVKPKGEVIDLNTKWSGVAEIKDEAVSFEDHLVMLNEVMDRNTILVGHGLENDLNAMRIIHNNIVDTAILYPKYKTSPSMRFSLQYLCFTFLGRTIQTGEHDSGEDSLGAIDVVKYFLNKEVR
ncbi:putative RNA exonuclease 3 [[Candida] railenensis]|uniref:RNA exonuclease 3 n=1 Tax=[Candida] railenensis TaxID=45579 RepID=A0A9P0QU76_9ASCO|nr:putative RNA exonuclease 3 [[Candida] railenensis]